MEKKYDYSKISDIELLCNMVNEKYGLKKGQIGSIAQYKDMYVNKIIQIGNEFGGYFDLKVAEKEKDLIDFLRLILDDRVFLNTERNNKMEKYLDYEDILDECEKIANVSLRDFFKVSVLETLRNFMEVNERQYKVKLVDIEKMVTDLINDDDLWNTIDFAVIEKVNEYEK